jgi:membrane associated rhomboid family serine protease
MKLKNAVMPLVGVNVLVFILQLTLGTWFTESFMLISSDILTRPWILLTSMFLHGGIGHLFFNMYVLFMFGSLLETRIGTKKFLFIYFLSGIFAAFASSFLYARALGASGAIYGVLGMIVILIPEIRVMPLFLPMPMKLWQALLVFTALDLFVFSGVAVAAHVVGAVVGLVYALTLRKQKTRFYDHGFSKKVHLDPEDIEEYFRKGRL